ncbi:MAG: S8 family serine peptidase [Chloroflexota bacterium]
MTGLIRTAIALSLAALLLAAQLAAPALPVLSGPFGLAGQGDAAAKRRDGGADPARQRAAAPRHAAGPSSQSGDDDEHDEDLNDGDRAESCEVDRDGGEFCAGEVIVALRAGADLAAVVAEMADEEIAMTQLGAIEGTGVFLFGYAALDDDAVSERDLVDELLDVEINDARPVLWAELNYVGNAPQGNPSRFFPRDTGKPEASKTGVSWGKAKTAAEQAASCASGKNTLVAVIDTGIQRTHPAFAGRIRGGWNAFDGSTSIDDTGNGLNDDGDLQYGTSVPLIDEAVGHGTHVAGIVLQAAPRANILPIKALDSDGAGQAFYLARAIHYAVGQRANVINLSLGSTGNSRAVAEAVQRALGAGIAVVAAAGNDGASGRAEYPAALPGVIAVGATDRNDRAASFNSAASGIDLGAPGVAIASAFPSGAQGVGSRFATWSGSSMAAPWVSGAVAALDSRYAGWTPSRLAGRLAATADAVRGGGAGAGRVDIGAAAGCR